MSKGKRIPEFRPLPAMFRGRRKMVNPKDYARIYGNCVTRFGRIKRFSFQFRIDLTKSHRLLYRQIRAICGRILNNEIPIHKQGQAFQSFGELLRRTPWIRVRRIRNYKVGVRYG